MCCRWHPGKARRRSIHAYTPKLRLPVHPPHTHALTHLDVMGDTAVAFVRHGNE